MEREKILLTSLMSFYKEAGGILENEMPRKINFISSPTFFSSHFSLSLVHIAIAMKITYNFVQEGGEKAKRDKRIMLKIFFKAI